MRNGTNRKSPWLATLLATFVLVVSLVGCTGSNEPQGQDDTGADDGPAVVETQTSETEAPETEAPETAVPEAKVPEAEAPDAKAAEEEVAEEEVAEVQSRSAPRTSTSDLFLPEDGTYTSKDEVAWYLHTYGHLPDNYVTKKEAEAAGWKTQGLTVDEACPGKSIGGTYFGNYEGQLPDANGREWHECDIDYRGGKSRGAKRLVYSNDGLIYYTEDHYNTFERIY